MHKGQKKVVVMLELRFLDSMRFMPSSLDALSTNLTKDQFKNVSKCYKGEQLNLLLRKGVYPYEWASSIEKFGETSLPPKEAFYSRLTDCGISEEDYTHAQTVWNTFGCKTFRDYHNLYNMSDVLLLADVFETFRDVCIQNYKLDPAWYFTSPGLAWDAALKKTEVQLELLSDYDMLLMIKKGIRGGVSSIFHRYAKANNKYLGDKFDKSEPSSFKTNLDMIKKGIRGGVSSIYRKFTKANNKSEPSSFKTNLDMIKKGIKGGVNSIFRRFAKENNKSEPSSFITYLDCNNLYGGAMQQKLPTHGFEWMKKDELNNWRNISCILEVDLEYPQELHDLHNDYPLAPESVKLGKVEKLVPNLYDKEKYVVHYENLKFYESLGLKITNIHRGIKFEDSDWLKPYIDLNTDLRTKAKNNFEKDFYKLMNNSVFGKTMENIENRIDFRLVSDRDKAIKLAAKPYYNRTTIFDENLIGVHMNKTKSTYDKPIYLGMAILDISKSIMYEFHYNYMKPKFKEGIRVLFSDTDSLMYHIMTDDFYKDISSDIETRFDTSDYPTDHPSGIKTGVNKKVVGMFKDEAAGRQIEEFVGLRAKLYSYKLADEEHKKCKGVKKNVVKNKISHQDYKDCLFSGREQYRRMNTIRSRKHELYTEEINKVALSAQDDKRIVLPDCISTLAYGHYRSKI